MQPLISAKNGGHELHAVRGISVAPGRSITVAPAGAATFGPRAAILVAVDEDLPACVRARVDAVEHLRGAEEERFGGRRRGMAAARTAISAGRVPK
jgi:hypothetical protein